MPKAKNTKNKGVEEDEEATMPVEDTQKRSKNNKGGKSKRGDEDEEPVVNKDKKSGKTNGKQQDDQEVDEKPQKGNNNQKNQKQGTHNSPQATTSAKGKKSQQKDEGDSDGEQAPQKNGKPQDQKTDENTQENGDDDEEVPGMVKKSQKKKKGRQAALKDSDDESASSPTAVPKGKQVSQAQQANDEPESEEEEVIGMAKKKSGKKAKKGKGRGPAQDDVDDMVVDEAPAQPSKSVSDDEEAIAPAKPAQKKKNKKKAKPAAADVVGEEDGDAPVMSPPPKKVVSGFAGLTIEGDDGEEEEEAPKKKGGKKKGASKPEEEEKKQEKKGAGGEGVEDGKGESKDGGKKAAAEPKISRKDRQKLKRENKGKPKAVEEVVEQEEELDDYQKYLLAQEIKGIEAPSYVHLRTTAAERSKTGNDIKVDNLNITVPGRVLVRDSNLTLVFGGRYGLIGRNGLGKSTILQYIAQKDQFYVPPHLRILYVQQEVPGDDTTPIDYVLKADVEREWLLKEEKTLQELDVSNPDWMDDPKLKRAYTLKDIYDRLRDIESEKAVGRASAILVGLGFLQEDIKVKPSREYSGGWRMRISLARALFCRPEVLLLDEPTNHLDLHACFWLERYLSKWPKTLVVVSHEAAFLNEVVDHIILIKEKALTTYKGDYRHFTKARDVHERVVAKKKDKTEKEVTKLRNQSQKSAGSKAGAQAKDKLNKINVTKVERDDPSLIVNFPDPDYLPPPLLRMSDVSFGYDPKKPLFKHLDFGIDMDSKIALVGLNGVGKSTLMKLMAGELHETGGYVEKSRKIRIARFSQHHLEQLDASVSPVQYFQNKFGNAGSVHDIRQHLGRFGISGALGTNSIETLSGGQKSRVVLAELAWAQPHILFLDEPSNHLDIDAIEALARGLKNFQGGVVLISHNQRLISKVCNTILVVTKKGTVEEFNGDFDTYKESILEQMDFGDEEESK